MSARRSGDGRGRGLLGATGAATVWLMLAVGSAAAAPIVVYDNVGAFPSNPPFQGTGAAPTTGSGAADGANIISRLFADDVTPVALANHPWLGLDFILVNFNATAVTVRPRARWWATDGVAGAPGTFLNGVNFNNFTIPASSAVLFTSDISHLGLTVPSGTFWLGMTFDDLVSPPSGPPSTTGITAGQMDFVGLALVNPVALGSSADQVWISNVAGSFFGVNDPAGQVFAYGGGFVSNLGLRITADPAPEPATWATLAVGAALLLASRRRRRKTA